MIDVLFENSSNLIEFFVNSDYKQTKNIDPRTTLLSYLRDNGYTGTKYGCGEGGCGACTVVVAEYDKNKKLINYRSANSCLLPVCSLNRKQIITIEGIGNPDNPNPIQKRFAEGNGSQCGFCTPGIVMSFYALLKLNPSPTKHDIEESFDGNLCRCTGYRPILESAKTFASDCCSSQESSCSSSDSKSSCKSAFFNEYKPYDPSIDKPFPAKFMSDENQPIPILMKQENYLWIEPTNLAELLKAKSAYPNAKIVGGNTEIGVEMNIRSFDYLVFINISNMRETKSVEINEKNGTKFVEIGANITLSCLIDSLKGLKKNSPSHHNRLYDALLSNLKWFASRQIRNFATLAGNIVTGSPISDLSPILMANNAMLTVMSESQGPREIPIRSFFKGYRSNDLKPDEILFKISIELPSKEFCFIKAYKQAKRKDDDIAITNACVRVSLDKMEENNFAIGELNISYGGVAPTTIYLSKLESKFKGSKWGDEKLLENILESVLDEVKFSYSVPGGMPTYRRCLSLSFFTRFWYQIIKELSIKAEHLNPQDLENLEEIERDITRGTQDFGLTNSDEHALGTTNPHLSALKQVTGVAKYVDDIPKQTGELYGALVMSTKAHAFIKNVDASKALSLNGVHEFITYQDFKHNKIGAIVKDEEILASNEVFYAGQPIGLIVAESRRLAKTAALLVKIEYEPMEEIITIEDAIKKNSFFTYNREIKKGHFDDKTFEIEEGNKDEFVFEGACNIGGQEHFYLETQGCLVIPKNEDDELEIFSSTQNPSEVQKEVATALGISMNRVTCRVKRIGGGFGGKETRGGTIAAIASAAALKLRRPIRFILDRDVDMLITGTRHPFLGKYKVRITKDGFFKALYLEIYNNAGYSLDLSCSVCDRALTHCDNVYNFPKIYVKGRLAKTNIASNTAFRGFGGPQGMMITEMMISEISEKLNLDPNEIRQKNFYKENDLTHFSMPIEDWFIPEMWDTLMKNSLYKSKREEVDLFNANNKWKKRGLAIIPSKFGLSFTTRFLNKAGALVHIYTDGTILLSHGGVEMGQGLHTKMIQIAANTLNIPIDKIYIAETSTDKVSNTSPTAASVSSDMYGMAVMDACQQLADRIKPYRDKNPNGNIGDWALSAYFDRVNLSANGYYQTPDLTYEWETNTGRLYFYFTNGVAVSSVELDLLTGDHTILRSDIIMDIGKSINYSIDIGQIEGAFIQGVGWCTIEELLIQTNNNVAFTRGPGNYKIPGFRDIPIEFNVKILRDKVYKHLKTVKSSKGIGEPPLFLGASVFFALRDAVVAARKSNGVTTPLTDFPSPCTAEILRLACEDSLVKKSKVDPKITRNSLGEEVQEKLWAIRP